VLDFRWSCVCEAILIGAAFEWLLNQSHMSCKLRTLQERFVIATNLASTRCHSNMASLIRVALGGTQVDLPISLLKDRYDSSLLRYAARYLGMHHTVSMWRCLAEEESGQRD
jgi:hypothetical protein